MVDEANKPLKITTLARFEQVEGRRAAATDIWVDGTASFLDIAKLTAATIHQLRNSLIEEAKREGISREECLHSLIVLTAQLGIADGRTTHATLPGDDRHPDNDRSARDAD